MASGQGVPGSRRAQTYSVRESSMEDMLFQCRAPRQRTELPAPSHRGCFHPESSPGKIPGSQRPRGSQSREGSAPTPGRGSEQRWDGRSQQPTGHPFCLEDWPPWPWMPEPSRRQTRAWLWEEGRQRWCRQEVRAFHQAGPCEWGFSIPGQPWVGRGVRGGAVGDAGVTAHLTVSLHGPHGGALWKEARPG